VGRSVVVFRGASEASELNRSRSARRWLTALVLPATIAVCASDAFANGDPASHVLPSKEVFVPFDPSLCSADGRRLDSLTEATRKKGYPIKVAIIPTGEDLGTLFRLFGRPAEYARVLASELPPGLFERERRRPAYRLLVLMPGSAGLNKADRKETKVLKGSPVGEDASKEDLTRLAIALVSRLSRAAGKHAGSPRPKPACPDIDIGSSSSPSSGSGTAGPVLIGVALVAMVGLALILAARSRARNT
jgi:hypothetical protein